MSSLYTGARGNNDRRKRWWNPLDPPDHDVSTNPFTGGDTSTLAGRAFSGAVRLPDTILRGVANIGKAGYQDLDMSLHRGLRAARLPHSERRASRSAQGPEIVGPIASSWLNTATFVGRDLTMIPSLVEGSIRTGSPRGGLDLLGERLTQRGQEFSEDPSMFLLEHIGNTAITGALAAKPAQLGLASSRGALTTREAAQGLRPLAGRESRAVARNLTSIEAQAARESGRIFSVPQAIHFTDNAINHPYITAGRRLRDSVPGRLVRHPLERAEAQARFAAMFKSEKGELNFRREDPRSRWNEIQDELGSVDSYLEGEQSPNRVALQNELAELELGFRSRGIEIPQDGGPPGSGISGRFDPAQANPRDVTTTPDFAWMEDTPGLTSSDFVESTIRPTVKALESQGITPEPNTIGRVTEGNITDVYATGPDGQIIGVLSVDPNMGINIGVLPQFQKQGIGSGLARYAWENDIPGLQQAANNSTFSDMGSGLANRALEEIDAFTPTEQIRGRPADMPEVTMRQSALDELRDISRADEGPSFRDETGAILPEGLGSVAEGRQGRVQRKLDKIAQLESREFTVGPVDYLANEAGLAGRAVRESPLFQQRFGSEARLARLIGTDLQRSMAEGTGEIADRASQVSEVVGNQELRRRYDPSRVERMFLRDLDSLARRPDAERYAGLIGDLPVDRPGLASLPGRVRDVASGDRVVGQTLGPEQLLARVEAVLKHAQTISARDSSAGAMTRTLQDMLPGVEPMGLYLMALDAADLVRGQPQGTLSSALGDFVTMDRFSDLNRQAQLAMRGTEWTNVAAPDRFRLPENMLDIDINAMPQNVRDIFYGAAEQYRRELSGTREPTLIDQGVIQPGGTRAGLAANEPTQFPSKLEELPVTQEARRDIHAAQRAMEDQANVTSKVEERLRELENSSRPMRTRDPSVRLTYRQGRPTQASFNRAWRTTPTGAAVKRWRERLGTEREKLLAARSRLEELERAAVIDPSNAPAAARNLLTYANEVAPTQARILRQMALENLGDPTTLRALADELDSMPRTINDLNSAEVYVAYLRDVKGKRPDGSYGPGSGRRLDTRDPGGARRRHSDILDVEFDRNFRTRAYWQDSEFQNWFMKREADQWVTRSGLARNGQTRLLEAGFSADDIARMTKRQKQQELEHLGLRAYDADSLFGTSRKPTPPGVDPLQAEWIAPHVYDLLNKSMEGPGWWEKRLGQGIYDPLMNQWKVFALPLRFAWQVNNYFGNATLSMLRGKVSPLDYPKLMNASQRAVRNWNQGIVSEIEIPIHGAYRAELTNKLNTVEPGSTQARMIENMLEEGVIRIDNSVLNDISSRGITRGDFAWLNNSQFLRDLGAGNQNIFRQLGVDDWVRTTVRETGEGFFGEGSRPVKMGQGAARRAGNLKQTGREVVDMAYHLNETVDNFHRAMVYMDQIGKGASHTQALAQVQKALGDYSKLNQFERRVVKRIYPFYPWMQHVARVVASSVHPSNIQSTVINSHLLNVLGQPNEWEELLPDWAGGHVYIGDTEDGTPRFFSTRGLNPFLDVFDPIGQPNMQGLLRPATPPLQFMYEQISGTSVLTGRPFSSPRGRDAGDRPPVSEYFFRNIPQAGAGRDVYRELMDQPLTRWGTGEPGFFPGADQRSGYSSVVRLLGANVQPLDVESMARQEKIKEYQQEVAQRRQERLEERYGGRKARDLLDNLPLVGN